MSKKHTNKNGEATQTTSPTEQTEQTCPEQPAQSSMTELEQALTEENERLIEENEALHAQMEKLSQTCKRLQSSADKSDTYLNQLVAIKSDFESYKRRVKLNAEQAKSEGVQAAVARLLPVCDNFELAKQHLSGDNLKAFEMVYTQFLSILQDLGVREMNVLGQPFDPLTMNALSKMDCGQDNRDKVVQVYKKGYVMGDKVLRYAEVIVGA